MNFNEGRAVFALGKTSQELYEEHHPQEIVIHGDRFIKEQRVRDVLEDDAILIIPNLTVQQYRYLRDWLWEKLDL